MKNRNISSQKKYTLFMVLRLLFLAVTFVPKFLMLWCKIDILKRKRNYNNYNPRFFLTKEFINKRKKHFLAWQKYIIL
jgi:hypothetical protein